MLKVLLKHIIYECCIDVLFNRVGGNFLDIKPEDHFEPDTMWVTSGGWMRTGEDDRKTFDGELTKVKISGYI